MGYANFTINKAGQSSPAAPTEVRTDRTAESVTINVITGQEYGMSSTNDPNGVTRWWLAESGETTLKFTTGVAPDTTYYFFTRKPGDANHEDSPASSPLKVTTNKASLSGTVTIIGTAKFGETLTADASLSATPDVALGTLKYQWKRGSADIGGASERNYTITGADIGQRITVEVSSENCAGSVGAESATAIVSKADGPAAPANVTGSYTGDGTAFTYIITPITGAEYSKDGITWQESNELGGFTTASPVTTFYARMKETTTHFAGGAGATDAVTFTKLPGPDAPSLEHTVSAGNFPKIVTITAVPGAEYSFDGGSTWSSTNTCISNIGETLALAVRLKETATHEASDKATGTIRITDQDNNSNGSGGSTNSSTPGWEDDNRYGTSPEATKYWEEVSKEITAAAAGTQGSHLTLNVLTGKSIVVTPRVLQSLKNTVGSTLAMHTGAGITFSISDEDVAGSALDKKINLSVRSDEDRIPEALVQERISGAEMSRTVSLESRERFGMTVSIHLNLGSEHAEKYANLYRYNERTGRLEYSGSFRITQTGQAMFGIQGGAEFLVTVTEIEPDEKPVPWDMGDYTVQRGDTLSRIAARNGISLEQLIAMNPDIRLINRIHPGQRIRLQ